MDPGQLPTKPFHPGTRSKRRSRCTCVDALSPIGSAYASAWIVTLLTALGLLAPAVARCAGDPFKSDTSVGPYKQKCTDITTDKSGTLRASCKDFFGKSVSSSLSASEVARCPEESLPGGHKGEVWNVDGQLRCVLSSAKFPAAPASHGDIFDIVSKSESTDGAGTTTVWRVDHPDVAQASTPYSEINVQPGEDVKLNAGGCVHTGGGFAGKRWKQYVNPGLDFPQDQRVMNLNVWSAAYAGGVEIADKKSKTQLTNEPLEVLLAHQLPLGFLVPGTGSADYPQHFIVSLLYFDNDYTQTGYYSHDDGTYDQCKNVGPAWATVAVFRPAKPVAYSRFEKGRNFDLVWRIDEGGIDDNGLPLNPMWSYQLQHPDQVPDFKGSCVSNTPQHPGYRLIMDGPTCTSQPTVRDGPYTTQPSKELYETLGLCYTSEAAWPGHINWRIVTYLGGAFYRGWSGEDGTGLVDDDINFGLATDDQSGQTAQREGPDIGIGLEFRNSETTANYTTPFWKVFHQNATSQGGLTSVNGNSPIEFADGETAVVTGVMGIDGVHKGYSEVHPVFAMAIEVAWKLNSDGSADETWAFFIRNQGNEGECSHNFHDWPSLLGDWTYAIQLPWPEGATHVKVITTPYSQIETSSAGEKFLGVEGLKPWTYLRFQLPGYTRTGIDGEITLRYDGVVAGASPRANHHARTKTSWHSEDAVHWAALSSRIADPALRKQFLADIRATRSAQSTQKISRAVESISEKEVKFSHPHDIGAWTKTSTVDIQKPDTAASIEDKALDAVIEKYLGDVGRNAAKEKPK